MSMTNHIRDGRLCLNMEGGQFVTVGWPGSGNVADSVDLRPNTTYGFSFRLSVSDPKWTVVIAKVGQVSPPYAPSFQEQIEASQELGMFNRTFTPSNGRQSGVVFLLNVAARAPTLEICIDDVSIVELERSVE